MTDEQAERLIAVQTAQFAMLQGIFHNVVVLASGTSKAAMYNWTDVKKLPETA
jgi:hypothetical protein